MAGEDFGLDFFGGGGGGGGLDLGPGTNLTTNFTPPDLSNIGADMNLSHLASSSGIGGATSPLSGDMPLPSFASATPMSDVPDTGASGFDWRGAVKDASSGLGLLTNAAQIPLQVSALNQAARNTKIAQGAASTAERAAAPAIAASERLTPAGTEALLTGKLPPELEAAVNDQVNQVRQQLLQQLEAQGTDPATANAQIDAQMAELRNRLTLQYAEGLLGGGSTTGSQAVGAAGTAGSISGGLAGAEGASLQAANQALGRLVGSGT